MNNTICQYKIFNIDNQGNVKFTLKDFDYIEIRKPNKKRGRRIRTFDEYERFDIKASYLLNKHNKAKTCREHGITVAQLKRILKESN